MKSYCAEIIEILPYILMLVRLYICLYVFILTNEKWIHFFQSCINNLIAMAMNSFSFIFTLLHTSQTAHFTLGQLRWKSEICNNIFHNSYSNNNGNRYKWKYLQWGKSQKGSDELWVKRQQRYGGSNKMVQGLGKNHLKCYPAHKLTINSGSPQALPHTPAR